MTEAQLPPALWSNLVEAYVAEEAAQVESDRALTAFNEAARLRDKATEHRQEAEQALRVAALAGADLESADSPVEKPKPANEFDRARGPESKARPAALPPIEHVEAEPPIASADPRDTG